MLESDIELAVVAWAEDHGWEVRKGKWVGRDGAPDRVFFGYGVTIWMEMKRPGEAPRPNQVREHRRMAAGGAHVHVVDRVEDGIAILRSAMR